MADRHKPPRETAGSYALHRCGRTRSELRRILSATDRDLSRWLAGRRRPNAERRRIIQAKLGIPVDSWDQNPPEIESEADAEIQAPGQFGSNASDHASRLRTIIDQQLAALISSDASAVVRAQARLKALGFSAGPADGAFGAATQSAVKAYQQASGLIVSGQSQGERIEALEDAESNRDQTLERIEGKLDGLHTKDAEHDQRLDKLHTDVKEVVSDGVGNAQQSLSKAKWGAVLVLLVTTAPTWLPEIVKIVELLAK